jgi:LysM repeat protein
MALGPLTSPSVEAKPAKPKIHRVYQGQHLGMIARRYNVTVDALRRANDIEPGDPIHPGQELFIPPRTDLDGSETREQVEKLERAQTLGSSARALPTRDASADRGKERAKGKKRAGEAAAKEDPARASDWRRYAKPAPRRGRVELRSHDAKWQGYVVGKGSKLLPAARRAFSEMLSTSDGRSIEIDARLVRLVTQVSDTFGGRPIHVVSGYRLESYARASKHKSGQAIDFSIPGVPNAALREYLKTLPKVGIGYYPNSSFVHLDVREQWTYWVDYSGPGEPPRYAGFWTRPPTGR